MGDRSPDGYGRGGNDGRGSEICLTERESEGLLESLVGKRRVLRVRTCSGGYAAVISSAAGVSGDLSERKDQKDKIGKI